MMSFFDSLRSWLYVNFITCALYINFLIYSTLITSLGIFIQQLYHILRLFDKHKQFEESQQKIAQLEENIEELNHKIEGQEEDLRQKEADITR